MTQLSLLLEERLVSRSALPDLEKGLQTHAETSALHFWQFLKNLNHAGLSGKMSRGFFQAEKETILPPSCRRLMKSGIAAYGEFLTLNTLEYHNDAEECLLSDILEVGNIPHQYYLSPKACAGILDRAGRRGKVLPVFLETVLKYVATKQQKL